ncbi:hypothetical protein Dimus_023785, partial [Dionaea muscipula]
ASTSSSPMLCHDDEKSALIRFKQSFSIVAAASTDPFDYPKTLSWKPTGNGSDCCIWDGVECDQHSSHVIGLDLSSSFLDGPIPQNSSLFELVHLQSLNLSDNNFRYSKIPSRLGLLVNLKYLNLSHSRLSGQVPISLTNLSRLSYLDLGHNDLDGEIPFSIGKLSRITHLELSHNYLIGKVPISLTNLTLLSYMNLAKNSLVGEVPSLANLTKMIGLDLRQNKLQGSIRGFIPEQSKSLGLLLLSGNNFDGPLHFETFLGYRNLQALYLSNIDLIMPTSTSHNNNSSNYYPQFVSLILEGCNLVRFPDFLHNQTRLAFLILGANSIQGPVPMLPPSLVIYDVGVNELRGEIPMTICNATSLQILRLSFNKLSGRIPMCLFDLNNHMTYLDLGDNHLLGMIPETFKSSCKLKVISLGNNQLEGGVPRSLANCTSLALLDLSSNNISDTFPIWLSTLPSLQALNLLGNKLHGPLPVQFRLGFPMLHILELSHNHFTGEISNELFDDLYGMQKPSQTPPQVEITVPLFLFGVDMSTTVIFGFIKTQKDKDLKDVGISIILPVLIDLSSNSLVGKIPDSIGNLVALHIVDLSGNNFTGSIPSSLMNLSDLEYLDLSHNLLSGEIPQQLSELTFLSQFNVSYNQLTGHIPQDSQFSTFGIDSFMGNPGLCGSPLDNKCGNLGNEPPATDKEEESSSVIDWVVRSMGCLSGLVVGIIVGHVITTNNHEWFVETFGRRKRKKRRRQR